MSAIVENWLYRAFRFNPCITMNELRMRMRGARPFLVLLFYSLIAAAAVLLALIAVTIERRMVLGPGDLDMGRTTFAVLAHTQLTLIMLILPAYSAGAITMEREKRTLDMLRVALVTAGDVVTGKLLVILAFALVLLLTSLPVAAWCMLLGGLAPEELFWAYSYLFLVAAFVSAMGMFYSTLLRRSMAAIVVTYGTLIVLGVLSLVVPGIIMMAGSMGSGQPTFAAAGTVAVLLIFALLSGWMIFLAVGWVLTRALRRVSRVLVVLLGLVLALVWVALVLNPAGSAYLAVEKASVSWLMVINPYVALSGVMDGAVADAVVMSPGGAGTAGSWSTHIWIWAIAGVMLLAMAMGLWALSIRVFRARA